MNKITNLPVSSNQKGLWIFEQQNTKNPAYNVTFTYHLKGAIDTGIFNRSIQILFDRQHSLFSVFRESDGILYIDIIPREVKVELVDFSDIAAEKRRDEIRSFVGADAEKWFDLEKGPLYRLYLLKYDDSEYYFHATIHHIVFDGWSRQLFVDELSSIYTDLYKGLEVGLKPIEYHSYDLAGQDLIAKSGRSPEELKKFWTENLKGFNNNALHLPSDRQRPMHSTGLGQVEFFIIPENVITRLRELAGKKMRSLFQIMASTLGLFLHKVTGDDDICIGIPVSKRIYNDKMAHLIGFFVETTIVRFRFDPGTSIIDFIDHAGNIVREALRNSPYSFDRIVETLHPPRIPGVNPYFQVTLSWMTGMTDPMDLCGIRGEKIIPGRNVTPFDLAFFMSEKENALEVELIYSSDLFNTDTIQRLIANYLKLLDVATHEPHSLLSSFNANADRELKTISASNEAAPILSQPVISEEEIRKIEAYNNTRTSYPSERTIAGLFKDQVALYPDKEAVVFRGVPMTYRELDILSDQIASKLRVSGLTGNSPVAVFGDKSPEVIAAIIGILKAGGIYVPIDPEYPEERIAFILKDSGSKIVLVQEKYAEQNFGSITKIALAAGTHLSDDSGFKEEEVLYGEAAYIMYTSGTTGIPKGSLIPQRGIIRLVRNINYIDLTQEDRILMTGVLVFDASTFEIWGALLNGGTLYIAGKETILDPDALGRELLENKITIMWLTSGLFTQIAEIRTDIFRDLKYLLVGGDVLSAPHINKVRRDNPQLKVINGYGPTENTTFSITCLIDREYDHSIPIGRPVSNSTAYIFDSNMNLLPPGIVGELYVGGDGLSTGYINRDDLNTASFRDHPYKPGERIYRTGDHAKWLPDGNIEFHGRRDNQVKIKGYRVETDEVEAAISDINEVIETVVKPEKTENGDVRLIAFLNVTERFSSVDDDLRRKLKAKLPSYMIPSAFNIMKGFPKTINGKTDRKALVYNINDIIPPAEKEEVTFTPSEKIIYEIWSEALKKRDIGLTDNFFDIGGNSLMAISVFSKIQKAFNKDLQLRLFFDNPSIKDIAETFDLISSDKTVESKKSETSGKDGPKIIKGDIS